jgi:phosphoglycerate dehydrogenase-like enzyme
MTKNRPLILLLGWAPEGVADRWRAQFPDWEFVEARDPETLDRHWDRGQVVYGQPPADRVKHASNLRWVQLASAGVPQDLCAAARASGVKLTNLAGLYGPGIAEHALALMILLARNLHLAIRNQGQRRWDRTVAEGMSDLRGRTLAVLGLGNIGRNIARLGRACGMRVVGCRRTDRALLDVDRLYLRSELPAMLGEADFFAVAAPLTIHTEGMLGPAEFAALRPGAIYINISRGGIAQESALLEALRLGRVAAAGLDVFAAEPLPSDHPFWDMPQVIISPHYSGETVNNSPRPAERFARNLHTWQAGKEMEGVVDLEWGY